MNFLGYKRPNGQVGVRNHVLVLPVSYEVNQIAQKIVKAAPQAVTFRNQHGINQVGADLEQTLRVYRGFATHPNVYGVLLLAWGFEAFDPGQLVEAAAKAGKAVEVIILANTSGVQQAVEQGTKVVRRMLEERNKVEREPVSLSDIILGTECGGSDACSGISANPALGVVSDKLVQLGGTSILAETTELIGAEHLLSRRAVSDAVSEKLLFIVNRMEENAMSMGVDIRGAQPAPGNIEGGITTIEEKSLGCIHKGGTSPIHEVIEYAEHPSGNGLVVMDTPGHDIEQLTGMVAGGAQIVVFTTGRGTPTGCCIAPVIKVSTNTMTFDRMNDHIDLNAGTVIDGQESVPEVGQRLFQLFLEVAGGKQTKAEQLGHHEFGMYRVGHSI